MSNKMALDALTEIREALRVANETPNGPITDTIWMPGRPETLFDAFDAAIAALQAEPPPANLADTPTPKPQGGMWTLTAPDGRTYQADSPLRCCGLEQRQRVPADVAMARIFRAASEPDDSELLDWLDSTNKRFKMGWKVSVAPAGNCSVQSVIFLGNSEPVTIRAAIRAALLATPPKD